MLRNGFRKTVLTSFVIATVGAAPSSLAEEGYFVGVSVVAALYDATYDKTVVLFDDLGVRVPTRLEASEIGLGVSLLWTF